MITRTWTICFACPISNVEVDWFKEQLDENWSCAINKTMRILSIEGPETIEELSASLSKHEFMYDILNIRETVDYELEWEEEEMLIVFTPENDDG